MKEFNINMEGYNVNGICVSCLSHNRRMFAPPELPYLFRVLGDIEIPAGVLVQVCWECFAAVRRVQHFQAQIRKSFAILEEYSRENPFLNSPSDLSKHGSTRLKQTEPLMHEHCALPAPLQAPGPPSPIPVKEEDLKFEHIEVTIEDKEIVKVEIPDEYSFFLDGCGSADEADLPPESASDDEKLSVLSARKERPPKREKREKREKKKKRSKPPKEKEKVSRSKDSKERRALQLKNYRKLNNLPGDTVELVEMDEARMFELRVQDLANAEFVRLKYKCVSCIMGFNTQKLMEDHMANKHTPKDAAACHCDVCKVYLLTPDNVLVHRQLHMVGYRCLLCGFSTATKHLMMRHIKRQHRHSQSKPDEWPCTICNETFNTKSKLSYHRGICHQERPQCDCCGKVFANKMTLKYHLKILPYDKADKPAKEKLYLPCKGCNKVFYSRKSYRAHVVIHEGVEYPCPVCGKLFQWKRNLARHIRNHREKDTGTFYECRQCNKRFSSKDCFNNHMKFSKKHVSEESYGHECEHCGKRFPTRWCLVDHVDWDHFRKVKYECAYCLKAFKTAKIMYAHVNNIHENKKNHEPEGEHLCDICGKSYKTVKRLKGHVWAMHTHRSTTKTYKCKLCPATFTWQTSIYKHVKCMHSAAKQRKPVSRMLRIKMPPPVLPGQYFQQPVQPAGAPGAAV